MLFTQIAIDELKIGGYANKHCNFLATDSLSHCFNTVRFKNYPHHISYEFNSLGYRERPTTQYQQDAIIMIGDSAVTGVGLPNDQTLSQQLERICGRQVLNFSLLGASNDWIARKLPIILKYFSPPIIIVHYTFSHRRENKNSDWFDNERTLCDINPSPTAELEDFQNWYKCYQLVCSIDIPVVHSFIPNWHPTPVYPTDCDCVQPHQSDIARDGLHYGPATCQFLAEKFAEKISIIGALQPNSVNALHANSKISL